MPDEIDNKPARRTERLGKYEIVGHIATGGMGVVYKARDLELDRYVALKILPPDLARQKTVLVRFSREAQAAARLRHENIVTLYDFDKENDPPFIAFEFIDGATLQDYINRKCRLDPDEVRQIMIQATKALMHAHEKGIVHRDVKPSNFLLTRKGDRLLVKLADFGLAIRNENDAEFRITRAKTTVGTVDYMSPEQARDSRSADIRSDIYSLGCTAFHMLAGMAPFAKGTLPERIVQHMQAPPPDMRKLNKSVPSFLTGIINRMLAKNPDDRYQTPAELLSDLENPENILVPDPRPAPPPERKEKPTPEPTGMIETKEVEEVVDEALQAKVPRPRKTPARVKEQEDDEPAPRDLTDEFTEPSAPRGKRERTRRSSSGSPSPWIFVIGGSVAALFLAMVLVLAFSDRTPPKKDPEPKPPPPIVVIPDKRIEPPEIDTSPSKMTVPAPALPNMDLAPDQIDRAVLRKDYYGSFAAFPTAPGESPVLRVGRFVELGPGSFRSLAEAAAQTKMDHFSVIEIHDDGPVFASALPPLAQRWLLIRGADGHRPLIVWDLSKKTLDAKSPLVFASLTRGKLILDNLDIVVWAPADTPATLLNVPASDFYARNCTFSVAGGSGQGITLVRRLQALKDGGKTQTWLQRCFVRGPELTLLHLLNAANEVLIEDSLVAGYQRPLVQIRGRDEDDIDLHIIRSTLVSGQNFLRWQGAEGKGGHPIIKGRVLDSVISRGDASAPQGDMIQLADGADAHRMEWRVANSVYAGWKKLLSSEDKSIAGNDLASWHRQWIYSSGDRALAASWPALPPGGVEDVSASAFLTARTPIGFASLTGPAAIGCTIGRLPTAPAGWQERIYEQRPLAPFAAADFEAPRLPTANDDRYHGERLDLTKVDLGAHLNAIVQKGNVAPRVVMHLTGSGPCWTTPLRIKGIKELVLYFEQKFPNEMVLEVNPANLARPTPAIEMTGGRLELIGLRMQLTPLTFLPTIVAMQDGDLTLTRCWLQGPLVKMPPETFQSLLQVGATASTPTTVLVRDCAFLSGKALVEVRDNVQFKARNTLFFSLGDSIVFDANTSQVALNHVLDHNTFAARRHALVLKTGPQFEPGGVGLLQANCNTFWSPFADGEDQRAVLRGADAWLSSGRFWWQGRFNVFDTRLPRLLVTSGKQTEKQTLQDWQKTWGPAAEQDAIAYNPGLASKLLAIEGVLPPLIVGQLDRLALPKSVRGDPTQNPPGADLFFLGIQKKKS
jgi:serine/threonine-protein kinase